MENLWTLNDTSHYHCHHYQDHSPPCHDAAGIMCFTDCDKLLYLACIEASSSDPNVLSMSPPKSQAWSGLKRIPNPFFFVIQFRVATFMKIVIQSQTGVCYGHARTKVYICDVLLVGLNIHMEYYVKDNLYPPYT